MYLNTLNAQCDYTDSYLSVYNPSELRDCISESIKQVYVYFDLEKMDLSSLRLSGIEELYVLGKKLSGTTNLLFFPNLKKLEIGAKYPKNIDFSYIPSGIEELLIHNKVRKTCLLNQDKLNFYLSLNSLSLGGYWESSEVHEMLKNTYISNLTLLELFGMDNLNLSDVTVKVEGLNIIKSNFHEVSLNNHLRNIYISHSKLFPLSILLSLKNLEEVTLISNDFLVDFSLINNFNNLKSITIINSKIIDSVVVKIASVQKLSLISNNITFLDISECLNLQQLDVTSNRLTNIVGFEKISNMLIAFYFCENPKMRNAMHHFPNLMYSSFDNDIINFTYDTNIIVEMYECSVINSPLLRHQKSNYNSRFW